MPYKWNDTRYNLRTIIETIENTQSRFVDSMEDLTHLSRQSMRPQSASTQTFLVCVVSFLVSIIRQKMV